VSCANSCCVVLLTQLCDCHAPSGLNRLSTSVAGSGAGGDAGGKMVRGKWEKPLEKVSRASSMGKEKMRKMRFHSAPCSWCCWCDLCLFWCFGYCANLKNTTSLFVFELLFFSVNVQKSSFLSTSLSGARWRRGRAAARHRVATKPWRYVFFSFIFFQNSSCGSRKSA